MKTMKIWRIVFMTLAAFFLASCSSDDDEETVSGSDDCSEYSHAGLC